MNSILVTGGAGFIGSHLCEKLLENGWNVINLDNFNSFYDPDIKKDNICQAQHSPNYTLVTGDIRDGELLKTVTRKYNITAVVHLAALAGVRNSLENPGEYVDIDIRGTVNVLEACRNNKIKKLVFASSSSVYGSNPIPFRENDKVDSQISPYAVAKRAGELYCRNYNFLYGIPTVCLRFFTVYGPRQRPEMAVHRFTKLIDEERELPVYGNGLSSRDYTYIDDIVKGIISAIDLNSSFEIFNLGNSTSISLDYLIHVIEKAIGKPAKRKYLPLIKGDAKHTFAELTKSKAILGYMPTIAIEEGVNKFLKWYKR